MTTSNLIKILSTTYLDEAVASDYKSDLLLVGSHSSPFLRSVNRLAQEVGIDSHIMSYLPPLIGDCKVVVDRETCDTVVHLPAEADVDNLYNPGTSCVSYAVYTFLEAFADLSSPTGLEGKTITVVGEGHAVKGLAERLVESNATVTVAHSHTKNFAETMYNQDIVVLATPTVMGLPRPKELVLDIGGALNPALVKKLFVGCKYEGHIGKLTNAVLLSRVAGILGY